MIASFRLPDLVLGVSVRADTSGARQAARDLKSAVAGEFSKGGGIGGAGRVGAGAFGGSFLGSLLGGRGGGRGGGFSLNQISRSLNAFKGNLNPETGMLKSVGFRDLQLGVLSRLKSGIYGGGGWGRTIAGGAAAGAGMRGMGGLGRRIGGMFGMGRIGGLAAAGAKGGPIIAAVVAVAVAIYAAVKIFIASMTSALAYIRRSNVGTTGPFAQFGQFSQQVTTFSASWENLKVQFGLFLIETLNLGSILESLSHMLVRIASIIDYMSKSKFWQVLMKLAAIVLFGPMANPKVLELINKGMEKLWPEGWGGKQFPAKEVGGFGKMAPAAIEGSVQAYSIIRGNMMKYFGEIAKNTKVAADALQQMNKNAPQLGVVAG